MSAMEHLQAAKAALNLSTEDKDDSSKAQIDTAPSSYDMSQVTDFGNALY